MFEQALATEVELPVSLSEAEEIKRVFNLELASQFGEKGKLQKIVYLCPLIDIPKGSPCECPNALNRYKELSPEDARCNPYECSVRRLIKRFDYLTKKK